MDNHPLLDLSLDVINSVGDPTRKGPKMNNVRGARKKNDPPQNMFSLDPWGDATYCKTK